MPATPIRVNNKTSRTTLQRGRQNTEQVLLIQENDIGSARPWDWQLLVNGSIDEHAYELGAIDTSLPFAELKRLSHINDRARTADRDPAFSSRIRDGLPGM